jgi:hypothetical protein
MSSTAQKLPYRNIIQRDNKFELDKTKIYKNKSRLKPSGLWYQINNSHETEFGVLFWGEHIYELVLDAKCVCQITNLSGLIKFNKKYGLDFTFKDEISENKKKRAKELDIHIIEEDETIKSGHIKWDILAKEYCGFEIKNYSKIKKKLLAKVGYDGCMSQYLWFFSLDFSSGCLWKLDAIKSIKYWGKLT